MTTEPFNIDLDIKLDDSTFDIDINLDFDKEDKNPFYKLPVYKMQKVKVKTSLELAEKINIQKNDRYIVFSHGNFIFGDFVISLIQKNNYIAEEVTISTLSLNLDNLASIEWALDNGWIQKFNLIVSDFWYQSNKYKFVPELLEIIKNYGGRFTISVCRSHTKIVTIKTSNNLFISIHGSANLTSSNNLEQFMIEESKDLFNIFTSFSETIIKDYQLTKKTAKRNELFNLI